MKASIPTVCGGAGGVCGQPAVRWFWTGSKLLPRCAKHAALMGLGVVAEWINEGQPIVEKTLDELMVEEIQNS